ncbi:MFS general substrate transporter [Clavulina sp. PMI_390]|nr:MFS general substrate transporter [Clavulina sp. PMI_390]
MSSFDEKQQIGDVEAQNTNQTLSPPQPAHLNARDKADHHHAFKVHWDDDNDPENPKNWSRISRWYYTILGSLLVFNATFASSSPGGIVEKVMKEFTFSEEVAALMISLFLAGYCVGPLFWGPLSEIYGRKIPFVVSFVLYTGFQVGCALSPNTGAILVFRFLGGCAASSPLANSGALMGDIWDQKTRGKAVALFTLAPFAGPAMGPVVGGFIGVSSSASWRWLFWVLTMFAGACTVLIVFTLPETYAPVILMKKAQRRRKETGDDRWWAPLERQLAETKFVDRAKDILTKPAKMLFLEPMLLAITIYMSFVYGCLYLLFEAYPLVFELGHGFNSGEDGLAFIPLFVGGIIGTIISVGYYNPRYVLLVKQYDPKNPPPESRLGQGVVGGAIFAIGFFWFGWTSYPGVSYWAPLMSGILFGLSLMFLFLSLLNYIIDVYLFEAASALSANTILRSMAGAGFPLFATQMFKAMNPRWASTMLGLIATVMIPIPLLFIRYGPALRAKSRYSPVS